MLLSHLESMKEQSGRISTAFQLSIDAAWIKLDKYYGLTKRAPVYSCTNYSQINWINLALLNLLID